MVIYKIILLLAFISGCSLYGQQPIAWYKFDDNAIDNSGNNNHGAVKGGVSPAMDRFGHPCGALQFDGRTGYIEVPSSPSLESPVNSLSVTVWYRLHQANKMNAWLTAVCKGNGNNEKSNPQYRLQVQQNTATPSVTCNNSLGSGTISINTAFTKCDNNFTAHPMPLEEWAFYALVYDGGRVTAWMNGQKIFEQNYSGTFNINNSPLYIGLDEPGLTEYYWGALDDLRIYREILSEQQVLDLYAETRPTRFDQEEFQLGFLQNHALYTDKKSCTATISFALPVIKSDCGRVTITQTEGPATGDKVVPGKYKISIEAVSTSGYTQNAVFYITVADTIKPVLKIPKDTLVYIEQGKKEIALPYPQPTATDNCGIKEILLESGLASGANFPMGQTIIKYRALDVNGNISISSFKVTIKEKTGLPVQPPVSPKPPPVPQTDIDSTGPDKHKADTTKPIIQQHQDSAIKKTDTLSTPDVAKKLRKPKEYQDTVEVNTPILMLEIYDNADVDGDTATIFLNRKVIVEKRLLTDRPILKQIEIDTTMDNELILYAENLGTISPNTATLIVVDGRERHAVNLRSDIGYSGTIIIRKKKKINVVITGKIN